MTPTRLSAHTHATRLLLTLALITSTTAVACSAQDPAPQPGPENAPAPASNSPTESNSPSALPSLPSGHDSVRALAPPSDFKDPLPSRSEDLGGVDMTPGPNAASRTLRRMSIGQLRSTISTVTGGLYWSDDRGNDILEQLAPSLGVPNYIDTTNEDLEPSLVFQKFLGDAVRSVCNEAIQNDYEMAPQDRVFMRFAPLDVSWDTATEEERQAIDRNLRAMSLRITGQYISAQDPDERLDRLRWLWRSTTHATQSPQRGWRSVCVALMASPEFYLY